VSIDKLKNGKYRVRWREVPGGPQKSKVFRTHAAAKSCEREVLGALERGDYVDPTVARKVTVADHAVRWMAVQPWRPSTRDRVESLWRTHIEPSIGVAPIGSVRTTQIQALLAGLDLAPASIESVKRLIASIFNSAVTDRLIRINPCDGVKVARRDTVRRFPLTTAEVAAIRDAIVPELRAAVVLGAVGGLRQGELFGLTDDRVQWLRRSIVIDRQLVTPGRGAPTLGPCKSARSVRTVPLPTEVVNVLAEHRDEFGLGDDGLLFHRDGRPWARNRAAAAFRAAVAVGGVEASGWHALRHHSASMLIAAGLGVTAVAATLGHSPAECLKTYAAWWPNEHDVVRAAMSVAMIAPSTGHAIGAAGD
jgi:integrase